MSSTKATSAHTSAEAAGAGETAAPVKAKRSAETLYDGTGAIDFVGRRKLWYGITFVLVVISLLAMLLRGFNMGIDFEGGTKMTMPAGELVAEEVEEVLRSRDAGAERAGVADRAGESVAEEGVRLAGAERRDVPGLGTGEVGVAHARVRRSGSAGRRP